MIIKLDPHTHTKYSDEPGLYGKKFRNIPRYGPLELIERAIKERLNAIVITDHDGIRGAEIAEKILKHDNLLKDKLTVIKGEEVSTMDGHILAININEKIKPGMTINETIDEIHKQGGIAVAPHPYAPYGLHDKIRYLKLEGLEVLNSWCYLTRANSTAKKIAAELNLPILGGSDAHALGMIGKIYTEVECEDNSIEEIISAILKKRSKPVDKLGILNSVTVLLKGLYLSLHPTKPKLREE